MVRAVLSKRLATAAADVAFVTAPGGKPPVDAPVNFNVSHSEERMCLAVTHGPEVGVDVQAVDDSIDIEAIAPCLFTPGERRRPRRRAASRAPPPVLRLWVLKEAWLEAQGTGFSVPLSQAEVVQTAAVLHACDPARPCRPEGEAAAPMWTASGFARVELPAPAGYAAALAVYGCAPVVWSQQWRPRPCLVEVADDIDRERASSRRGRTPARTSTSGRNLPVVDT